METEIVDGRKERGLQIAQTSKIRGSSKGFIVPSQSGHGTYLVQLGIKNDCTCPDCQTRGVKCKH